MHVRYGRNPDKQFEHAPGIGKFQGEARYVPYFFEQSMEGADEEWGEPYGDSDGDFRTVVFVFNVSGDDEEQFPELVGRETVYMHERKDGYFLEVTKAWLEGLVRTA